MTNGKITVPLIPQPPTEQVSEDSSLPSPMPVLSGNDLLLWSALPDLTLNIAQTASLCGVSVRQLGYWTKQGYVTATGRGARRLYGPESLRRILAIRQAMHSGLSLRQSLRALNEDPTSTPGASAARIGAAGEERVSPATVAPSPVNMEAVAADLIFLFTHNRWTRDSAGGLSTKLGRAESDVRQVAEHLAAQGALCKTFVSGEALYTFAERKSL